MNEREATELVQDIEYEHGTDSARAHRLQNGEWVVDLMGYTSKNKTNGRQRIYLCWSRDDWRTLPAMTKQLIRGTTRRSQQWAAKAESNQDHHMIKG